MTMRDLALEGLEQILNRLIGLDPAVGRQLAALHGRRIRVELSGMDTALHFVPTHDGRLQLLGSLEGVPDCSLRGSP